jgi:hypothetical protein
MVRVVSYPGHAAREIEGLLSQQRSRQLDTIFAHSLVGDWFCGPFECAKLIVEAAMTFGQGRLAGRWLVKLLPFCTPENVPVALALALRARQPALVLTLYARFRADLLNLEAEERLALASDTLHLALRLRLPKGRNGAWEKHRKLLKNMDEMTAFLPADAPTSLRSQADALRARLQEL